MAKKSSKTPRKTSPSKTHGVINGAGEVVEQPIVSTIRENYMPYAMSVILSRAIPEIDGFKPSHRKLLYMMYKMGLLNGGRTKSANIVGATMKLNPHGDSAIYDTMNYVKCDVSTICMGLAASMGAFLLAGGAKGKRLALPNSEIMIHQPSGGARGQETEIRIVAENILKTRNRLNEILAANTGKSVEEISRDTERDNYMTAQEAVAYGLIDSVVEKR
jgi:hypothetical protein